MTYIKVNLPDVKILKEQLKNPERLNHYRKYDTYIGSPESVEYLLKELKRNRV